MSWEWCRTPTEGQDEVYAAMMYLRQAANEEFFEARARQRPVDKYRVRDVAAAEDLLRDLYSVWV